MKSFALPAGGEKAVSAGRCYSPIPARRTWPLVELLSLPDVKNINFPKVTLMLLEPDKRWPGQSAPESSQSPDRSPSPTLHVQYVTAHASNIHNKFPPYTVKLREYALTSVRKKKKEEKTRFRSIKKKNRPSPRRDRFSKRGIRKILFDSMNRQNGIQMQETQERGERERERENVSNWTRKTLKSDSRTRESLRAKNFLRGRKEEKRSDAL